MNSIKLYVSAARLVLENERHSPIICKELRNTLLNLEHSLSCTVCRKILRDPHSPTETTCQHHVCKSCIGGRQRLKPSCRWCKDYAKYVRNTQLQSLLTCYKALCDYVRCSNLSNKLRITCNDSSTNKNILESAIKGHHLPNSTEIVKIEVDECEPMNDQLYRFHDGDDGADAYGKYGSKEYKYLDVPQIRIKRELSNLSSVTNDRESRRKTHFPRLRSASDSTNRPTDKLSDSTSDELDPKTVYSVSFAGTRSKIILKRKHVNSRRNTRKERKFRRLNNGSQLPSNSLNAPQKVSFVSENLRFRKLNSSSEDSSRPKCRCGNTTPKPGKLTCCGQRCACYMRSKACSGCRCKGCRNPHMIDGVKVLGRFAKEDSPDSNLKIANASSFQDMHVNFMNQQINQVLPNMKSNELIHIC